MPLVKALNLYPVYLSVIGLASPPARREQTVPENMTENNRPHGLHTGTSTGFFRLNKSRGDTYLTSLNQISLFNLAKRTP